MKFITPTAGLLFLLFLFLTPGIFIERKQLSLERMAEAEFMQLSRALGQKSLEEKPDKYSNATYPSEASSDWYVQAQQSIAESEYEINWQASRGVYSSPNRSHNLRFDYYPDGFTASPREHPEWSVKLTLDAYGKGDLEEYKPGQITISKNTASSSGEIIDIFYKNTKEGMRQDFLVKEKPKGSGMLKLILNVETQLDYTVTADTRGLGFTDTEGQLLYLYNDLRVTDATGKELIAGMEKMGNDLTLVVNDLEAIYPVLIDPLSTTADWTAESDQFNGWFGISVSTAGDVNGDGYSDVIVGANGYDNGQSDEGRAYVYLGSSAGLSSTASWTTESNQASARLGVSVAAAGDVNGDGYSDVIVGAYLGGQDSEGQAFVYHGGINGLSTTAAWVAESNQASAQFGISVSTAGDVNGDGYSDVIVGADFYDNGEINEGRAYVYLGSSIGLSPNAAWTTEGDQESAQFGGSVSTAGDVNGDGYSDVIVGAELFDNVFGDEGKVYVFQGGSAGLSQTASWTAISDQAGAFFGNSVSTAGDVNGDGYSDIIVGAQSYDNGESSEGRAYVYHGSAAGLNTSSSWTAESNQATAFFGTLVSTAGDVNGDGYADVMVAASNYDNGQNDEGRAYVYLGSNTGVSLSADWTAESDQTGGAFGRGISTAGDINGDGFSDVIIGAFAYDNGEVNEGRAYVYMGGSAGLGGTLAWTARSNQASADFGYSISTAGDVNGDGYWDVIVGTPRFDNGETDEGRAYLFLGSATGLATSAVWTAESNQATAFFAVSVASAGDVNGDGYSDVIVGADRFDNGETNEGRAYVYLGNSMGLSSTPGWTHESNISIASFGSSVANAGDVNGDGYSDVIVGAAEKAYIFVGSASGPTLTPWIANSDQENSSFGSSVSSAGDVNGDGYSDVIVGAATYDNGNGQADEGRAYVFLGSSNGPSTTAAWTAESNQATAQFGRAVAAAGDVNGDGYSDVIIGAPYFDNGQSNEGRVYVFLGSASGLALTAAWTAESDQASTEFGRSVSSAGDINGDGYSDVIIGAPLFDNGETDEGQAFVYRGSASGLSVTSFLTPQSDQPGSAFGWSVSSAGDVNGDGFSDILIGAYQFDNLQTDEGQSFLYYGATGVSPVIPRLLRDNLSTTIAPLGRTHSISSVGASMFANKSIIGRSKVKAQFEVKPLGTPFNASNLSESTTWSDTGINGNSLQKTITGLSSGERYKIRMRLHYLDSYFPYSRWIYLQGNGGLGETDFIVSNVDNSTQPATQASNLSFSAITENSLNLQWTSGNGTSRIVVARAGQAVDAVTWDGKAYTASSVFGSGSQIAPGQYVVYKGNGNTATITGLSANTTYHFRVFEFTGTGGLENYNATTATGNPNSQLTATSAPVLASASAVGQTSFQLSWVAVTGATNYSLDVSTNNFSTFVSGYSGKVLGNVTTTSVTGLPSGTNYQTQLRAVNSAGPSANSNIQTALTIPGTPNLNATRQYCHHQLECRCGLHELLTGTIHRQFFQHHGRVPAFGAWTNLTHSNWSTLRSHLSGKNKVPKCYRGFAQLKRSFVYYTRC